MDVIVIAAGVINSVCPLEVNDNVLRSKIKNMIESAVVASGEYSEVSVVCDESNNTPIIIDSGGTPVVDIYVKTSNGIVHSHKLESQRELPIKV